MNPLRSRKSSPLDAASSGEDFPRGGSGDLVTGRHTIVEVRRNLVRLLASTDAAAVRVAFTEDLGLAVTGA